MRWTWHSRQGLRKIREVATALNDNCCIRYSSKQAAKQALALCAEHTDWQGPLPLPQHLTSLLSNESLPSTLNFLVSSPLLSYHPLPSHLCSDH